MPIKNKSITISGADAKVIGVTLTPQYRSDGSVEHIAVAAVGVTKDGSGKDVGLEVFSAKLQPGQMAPVDNILARALIELRKQNGLET